MAREKSLETIIKEADGLSKRDINKLKKIYDKLGSKFAAAAAAELSKKSSITDNIDGDWVVNEH